MKTLEEKAMTAERGKKTVVKNIFAGVGKFFAFIGVFVLIIVVTLFGMLKIISAYGSSRNTLVTTLLESGSLKFLASFCASQSEIEEIVAKTSLEAVGDANIDEELITVPQFGEDVPENNEVKKDIEIVDIAGLTYKGTLMIIKDPSRVSVSTTAYGPDQWPEEGGVPLKTIVERAGALGGVNGGLFDSSRYQGDHSYGILVSNGVIIRNQPQELGGLVMIGLTKNNILQIVDVSRMTPAESKRMLEEKEIRDAVCFQEETSADNNHFVQLVLNGVPREVNGAGSGLNPRTAIGQRADGAILLLVTDGRGYKSHVGASAADLIEIMTRYGAVNAANLDGGSSTCMYYNGEYLQDCVTFYYSKTSWQLPCAFVVK